MIDLGRYKGKTVTTNNNNLKNHHICVTGASGSGKTVQCQRMISSAVKEGATVIAFDMHGTLAPDQIYEAYAGTFSEYIYEIDAHEKGIACNLFMPVEYMDGTEECSIDTVGGIVDVLADAIGAGSAQRSELRRAIQFVYDAGTYETRGIVAIDEALMDAGNKTAELLREKLYFLTAHNVFVPGETFYKSGHINIIRLSRFNLKAQKMIAEILLSYIWRLANADQFKQHGIYVFIDECQNMPSGKDSALAQILSEGRKFGVNLILATQMILQGTTSAVQQRITQCGLMLYFKPAANRVSLTAKMIDPVRESDWSRILRTLAIGEFIADGSFLVDGKVKNEPLKITAYEGRAT